MRRTYHYAFFETFFSFFKLTVLGELNGVKNEIFVKLEPKYLLFVVLIGLWFSLIFLLQKYLPAERETIDYKKRVMKLVVSFLLIGAIGFVYHSLFVVKETDDAKKILTEEHLYQTMTNKNRFMKRFGVLSYGFRDLRILFSSKSAELTKEEEMWIENYIKDHALIENEMTGIYKGKNLIMIMAESFAPFVIDETLTPMIYKMTQEGYYFDNFYAPVYQSATNDAEFVALTSMIPSINFGTTSYEFPNNHYPYALAHLFNQEGYLSNSYHSFIKSFYNREPFHNSLGFNLLSVLVDIFRIWI